MDDSSDDDLEIGPQKSAEELLRERERLAEARGDVVDVGARDDLCGNQNFTACSRHRRDACSMASWCSFLTARPSQDGRVIAET